MAHVLIEKPAVPGTKVEVHRLGSVSYPKGLALQRRRVREVRDHRAPDTLYLLSHPPVITMGRGGDREHLLASEAELEARGIAYYETDRGGDITFHGPGQIVGYAIVDLSARGRDLHRYLRDLEDVIITAVAEFGIEAGRLPGLTGVWTSGSKIAAMGIRVSRWIAHHGFALNVDTDLTFFDCIVPCGLDGRRVTSMTARTGAAVSRSKVEDALERAFVARFGRREDRGR